MNFDVAVVGAGPAGSCAAMALARRGFCVALIDRAVFPRDKACGEFVNPAASDLLESVFGLSFLELLEAGGAPVSHIRLELARRPSLNIRIRDECHGRFGVSIPREKLDALLVEKCKVIGVCVMEDHNVRAVKRGVDHVHLFGDSGREGSEFTVSAKLVLAADGTHSRLARLERLVRPVKRLSSIGIVAHFKGIEAGAGEPCVWMFPSSGDGLMFGFTHQSNGTATLSGVAPTSCARDISSSPEAFLRRWIARNPSLQRITCNGTTARVVTAPCFGHSLRRCYADRMLFLGDAATFVDPFTGEGIHHALESGVDAADVTELAFAWRDFSEGVLSRYSQLRRELDARYRLCDLVRQICSRPWFVNMWGEQLRTRPSLAEQLIGALTDVLPPSKILNPGWVLSCLIPGFASRPIKRQQILVRKAEQRPN